MANQTQDAAQGRRIAKGLGHDVVHSTLSEADWADYGRKAAVAMARGDTVPHPVEARATQPAPAPTRPSPAPARSSGGGGSGSGLLRSAARPVTSNGPVTRMVVALIAGMVVLELGSLVTGQYFSWDFGKGATPASTTPPTYKPLVPPSAQAVSASTGVGAVAAGVSAAGVATGTHETAPAVANPRGSAP